MSWKKLISVLFLLVFSVSCDRSPDNQKVARVNLTLPGGNNGFQAVGLPGGVDCIAILVHESADTDGSHCRDNVTFTEFAVTSGFGPFSAGSTVSLTLPVGIVTFHLVGAASINCSNATSSGLSALLGGSSDVLISSQSVNLSGGANNVTLSITSASGNGLDNCQGVTNVN